MSSQLLWFDVFRGELVRFGFELYFTSEHNSVVDSSMLVSLDLFLVLLEFHPGRG